MRDAPRNRCISFTQRIRNRRGRRALACDVSGRWLRFGDQFNPQVGEGMAVWVDVLTDVEDDTSGEFLRTRKLTTLMVRVEDLRAILEQFDEEESGVSAD